MQHQSRTTYILEDKDYLLVVKYTTHPTVALIFHNGDNHEVAVELQVKHLEYAEKLVAYLKAKQQELASPMTDEEIQRCEQHAANEEAERYYEEHVRQMEAEDIRF